MSKYATREELFEAFNGINQKQWDRWIMSLTVPASTIDYPLFHLSDYKTDDLKWNSKKHPLQDPTEKTTPDPVFSEPLPMRISTSSSLDGCFGGIYPKLAREFNDKSKNIKSKQFYLYRVHLDPKARVLLPTTAKDEWLIYDAHLTHEHCIFGKVHMELDSIVTIKNPVNEPEDSWVNAKPYDCEKYDSNVWIPPLIVLHKDKPHAKVSYEVYSPFPRTDVFNEQIAQESNMAIDFELKPSKELVLGQLSLEAMQNPLQVLSEGLMTRFNLVITKLSQLDASIQNLVMGRFQSQVSPNKVRHITEKKTYMQLAAFGISVPEGFIGPLSPYMHLLESTLSKYLNIRQEVLIPACTEMGVVLANPEKLQSNTLAPLSRVKLKTKDREYFEKHVKSFYSAKDQSDNVLFNRLFTSNGDFMECAKTSERLENLGKQANKVLDNIIDDINQLKELTTRLSVRITQDKQTYGPNARMANELAVIVTEVANEVSFFASLMVLTDQCIGIMDQVVDKVD